MLPFTGGPPDGSKERPFLRKDSEALSSVLTDLCVDVRFNLRNRRTEWMGLGLLDHDGWVSLSDRKLAAMREEIARQFYIRTREGPKPLAWGREAFHDTLSALLHYRERDPFLDFLDELPLWDGLAGVEGLLCNVFGAAWSPLAEWASLFMFLGVVQRTFEPECKLDEIPVLIGPQGIGKRALPRNAVPPDIPDLYGDGLRWDAPSKEQVEAVLGRAIVEVSEMGGRRKADIEHIKSFVTRQNDGHVRLAYARCPGVSPKALHSRGHNERRERPAERPDGQPPFRPDRPARRNERRGVDGRRESNCGPKRCTCTERGAAPTCRESSSKPNASAPNSTGTGTI